MTDYTPSTDEVREAWAFIGGTGKSVGMRLDEFDRMIRAVRHEAAALAWDKAHALWTGSDSDPNSPYRATGRTRAGSVGSEGVGSVCADGATDSSDERGEG